MKYREKLDISLLCGGLITGLGVTFNDYAISGIGFGLLVSNSFAPAERDEFADLREEFHKRERLFGVKQKPVSLRQIALDCVGTRAWRRYGEEKRECSLEAGEILGCAERHDVNPFELLDAIKEIDITNTGTHFEETVVNPIKRRQGIYD